jgi:hypothetical protein
MFAIELESNKRDMYQSAQSKYLEMCKAKKGQRKFDLNKGGYMTVK